MDTPLLFDLSELGAALEGFAATVAKFHDDPTVWEQQLEKGTNIPESAQLLRRHALLTERLMGQGATHTALLLVELGFQALAHIQTTSQGEGRGFFRGMEQAVRIFANGVHTFREVPDWRKTLEETYLNLKTLPDAQDLFSLAVREDYEVVLPKLHEHQVIKGCGGIEVACFGYGTKIETSLIKPTVCIPHNWNERLRLHDLQGQANPENQLLVFFFPSSYDKFLKTALARSEQENINCYFFELESHSPLIKRHIQDVCEIEHFRPKRTGKGHAAAVSLRPSGVTIIGTKEPQIQEPSRCLVTDIPDHEPAWEALDGSFRRYRQSLEAGIANRETISSSIKLLEAKTRDLPEKQAIGARAVAAAANKLIFSEPISVPATTFALENASAAVRKLFLQKPPSRRSRVPATSPIQLTSGSSHSLSPSRAAGSGNLGGGDDPGGPKFPSEEGEIHRYLDVLLVGEVCPRQRVVVTATIRLPESAPAGQAQSPDFVVLAGSTVILRAACVGFSLESVPSVERQVPDSQDSEPATFIFQVQESEARWIEISLFERESNQMLAQVTLSNFALQRIEKQQIIRGADSVDLTVNVGKDLTISVDSPRNCENLAGVEIGSIRGLRNGWRQELDKHVAALYQLNPEDVERELKLLGAEVANSLPQDLCQLLGRGTVKTLLIKHVADNAFPFELALLNGPEGQFFLGDRIAVGRWIRGIQSAPTWETKVVRRAALLKGAIGLANDELSTLKTTCCQTEEFSAPLAIREQVFRTRSFQLLHFFGHCACQDEPDLPAELYLELEEGRLRLREIGTLEDERTFFEESPVVVLNACGTGAPCYTLLSEDSFPSRFLRHNASFFMGTQWPVEETVAHTFAEAFYRKVSDGKSVGTAMLESKKDVVAPGSKLSDEQKAWARISLRSYMLFAHPDMKISFDVAA